MMKQVGMQRNFGHVLAAVGTRRFEKGHQAFVDAPSLRSDEAVIALARLPGGGQRLEQGADDGLALAPGKANHGDARLARRRRQGYDRPVIHAAFF